MEYTVTEGFVIIETGAGNISVVVASVKLPDTVEIKGSRLVPDEMIQLVDVGTNVVVHFIFCTVNANLNIVTLLWN